MDRSFAWAEEACFYYFSKRGTILPWWNRYVMADSAIHALAIIEPNYTKYRTQTL
jgi:uncharacterized cysteine cluster protein YcgN (CxxCxxCC family)